MNYECFILPCYCCALLSPFFLFNVSHLNMYIYNRLELWLLIIHKISHKFCDNYIVRCGRLWPDVAIESIALRICDHCSVVNAIVG
jgi:hypothetical protein